MLTNYHLIVHNAIGIISVVVSVVLVVALLINNPKKTVNITLALTLLAGSVFIISHMVGVSIVDPVLSRQVLMWNVSVIFICMFNFHCSMAALNREKERRYLIYFIYLLGSSFVLLFLTNPDTFILEPVAKMYFPNYYVAGSLQWVMRLVFQVIIPSYFVFELVRAYRHAPDQTERNRSLYFGMALGLGWIFGLFPLFLIWDIQVDPVWGLLFPIVFAIPFTYAILRYELMDIRIIAKKAFVYGVSVIAVGILITSFDLYNRWLQDNYPGFPIWAVPFASAVIIVGGGIIVWRQLRESELLKYEFITTVTHKFRTPLTHIKWATENLRKSETADDWNEGIGYVESANAKLVELTDLLANASETDNDMYQYRLNRHDLSAFVNEIIMSTKDHAQAQNIKITNGVPPETFALFDVARMKFVLQTLIENGINYTKAGGQIWITAAHHGKFVVCSVKDTGIGIPRNELSLMFTKLYRGKVARLADTEGMGIGLYISRGIIARHHGKMWVESDGENKGATFSFSLPEA